MVRKTTAEVKSSTQTSSKKEDSSDNIDINNLFKNARDGIQENWMTLVWFLLVLLWLIQLRELILGVILLTSGILLISWFFSKK